MSSEITLPGPKQRALFEALKAKPEVPIEELFDIVRGWKADDDSFDLRAKQMWLSKYLQVLRRRLEPHKLAVVPGDRKGTYRLAVL